MLRNVVLMATSGLVLFTKEFVNAVSQPRLVGSLITAMMEFSSQATGMPVSYIEFTSVAVTIVTHGVANVFCALFHDIEDGYRFGKLIATEVVQSFVEEYKNDLGSAGHNLKDFHGFHFKFSEVIRTSVRPILSQLQSQRGIQKAVLITDDSVTHATAEVDQLGVLANLQALLSLSSDILALVDDVPVSITLEGSTPNRIDVIHIERATLVISTKTSVSSVKCRRAIDECVNMLTKVFLLLNNLHQARR